MLAIIRGAGDIASARLRTPAQMRRFRHYDGGRTSLTVRRTVAFSEAIHSGKTQVEGVVGVRAESIDDALRRALEGSFPCSST